MDFRKSVMFNELCGEVAPENWKDTRGKGASDDLYVKLVMLFDYLNYHVHNPIEVLAEVTGTKYEATRTRLRIAKSKNLFTN